MALAFVVGAVLVVMAARLPDEVVVVLGDEISAPTPAADIFQDHVPGSLGVLALGQVQDLGHGRLLETDPRPGASSREALGDQQPMSTHSGAGPMGTPAARERSRNHPR